MHRVQCAYVVCSYTGRVTVIGACHLIFDRQLDDQKLGLRQDLVLDKGVPV